MDLVAKLRARALEWHPRDVAPSTLGAELAAEYTAAANEIERLRLFERYANRTIEAQVEDAIETKTRTGKYPFED